MKELEGALELLQNHGWIRLGQKKQPKGGGRPSQRFEVNPAVAQLDENTDETQPPAEENRVSSVYSSDSAFPAARPKTPDPAEDPGDECDFYSDDDEIPF